MPCSAIWGSSQMTVKRQLVINQPEISQLIRKLRSETGLTQEQFAASLGVTYSSINRWENGRTKPSPMAMQKIEELLTQRRYLLAKPFLDD